MEKIFLALAGICALGLLGNFVPRSQAEDLKIARERIRQMIADSNSCRVDDDCMAAYFECPFGCASYINKEAYEKIKAAVDAYNARSMMRCAANCIHQGPAICAAGKCVEQKGEER